MSPRTVRTPLLTLLVLGALMAAGCKSKPAGEAPDYGLAAEQSALAARQKFYDLMLDVRPANIYDLINAENELERDARKQLKPLVKETEDLADKAIKVDSKDVRGHLAKADALYLNAICNGSTTSFFCGLKRKVRKYYRKAKSKKASRTLSFTDVKELGGRLVPAAMKPPQETPWALCSSVPP